MLLSEAVKAIQATIDQHGDLPLRVNADHGQCSMEPGKDLTIEYVEPDEYMPEAIDRAEFDSDSEYYAKHYIQVATLYA